MKWISVKDKLPEMHSLTTYYKCSDKVLVKGAGLAALAILKNDQRNEGTTMFVHAFTYVPLPNVTHWAPMH